MVERSSDENPESVSSLSSSLTFQELSQIIKALPPNERDDICHWLENDKYLRLEEEFNVTWSQVLADFCDLGDVGCGT